MGERRRRLRRALPVVMGVLMAGPCLGRLQAQDSGPRVTVRVRQVAGATLYLDMGTRHGLATGDTLQVARDSVSAPVGRLVVTASTETRAVLTFADAAFPVTRGETLTLTLRREPAEAVATPPARPTVEKTPEPRRPPAASPPAATSTVHSPPAAVGRRAHGRIALDVAANRSVTTVGEADPIDVDRRFATPAFRLDATVPDAVGGFRLRTSIRLAYRYSNANQIQPATSTRVYAAALERDFTGVPVRLALGRFHSPVESYSGFWDGVFFRYGRDLGVGAIVGFEPDRWDERPSTSLPKATVFVDGMRRGRDWRWSGDLSAHVVRSTDSLAAHTFVGATQRITVGALHIGHDIQVDQDPAGGSWRVSQLRLRGALDLGAGVQLRGGFSRRETWLQWLPDHPFAPRSDRVDAGLAVQGASGYLAVDGSTSRTASGRRTKGGTASFFLAPGAVGFTGSLSRWSGEYGSMWSAAPGVSFSLDPAWLRLGYRYDRSDYLERLLVTHGVEASLDAPLAEGFRVSGRARVQWGGALAAQSLSVSLSRIF